MRVGPLSRKLAALVVPIFIDALLMMLLGAVDTFMLSRHSDNSVAAVGLVNQLVNLIFVLFQVITLGTSILCSQYIGAKLRDKVVQVVGISLMFNFLLGTIISAVLFFFAEDILHLMGMRDNLMPIGLNYMKIVGGFAFIQSLSLTISASLRSADKAVYPMMVSLVVNVVNIIGNYSLIFGKFGLPALGATGAAISTVISRCISLLLLTIILFRKHIPSFPARLFKPFPWPELGKLLKIGIPSAGEQFAYSSAMIVVTYFINSISNEALAARTYCTNIVMFVLLFALSMAQGGAIEIGHLVGMGKPHAAFCLGKRSMRLSIMVSLSLSFITACMGGVIARALTSNPVIINMICSVLWVDVILEIGRAINMFAVNALRSSGDVYFPVLLGIVSVWSIAVIGSYVLGIVFGLGIVGIWFALMADEMFRGVIFIKRWNSMKWATKSFVRDVARQ